MNDLLELLKWCGVVIGVTYGITQSALGLPVRFIVVKASQRVLPAPLAVVAESFIYCATCVGFWVALWTTWLTPLWPWGDAPIEQFYSALFSALLTTLWIAAIGGNSAYAAEHPLLHPQPPEDDAPQAPPQAQE